MIKTVRCPKCGHEYDGAAVNEGDKVTCSICENEFYIKPPLKLRKPILWHICTWLGLLMTVSFILLLVVACITWCKSLSFSKNVGMEYLEEYPIVDDYDQLTGKIDNAIKIIEKNIDELSKVSDKAVMPDVKKLKALKEDVLQRKQKYPRYFHDVSSIFLDRYKLQVHSYGEARLEYLLRRNVLLSKALSIVLASIASLLMSAIFLGISQFIWCVYKANYLYILSQGETLKWRS